MTLWADQEARPRVADLREAVYAAALRRGAATREELIHDLALSGSVGVHDGGLRAGHPRRATSSAPELIHRRTPTGIDPREARRLNGCSRDSTGQAAISTLSHDDGLGGVGLARAALDVAIDGVPRVGGSSRSASARSTCCASSRPRPPERPGASIAARSVVAGSNRRREDVPAGVDLRRRP